MAFDQPFGAALLPADCRPSRGARWLRREAQPAVPPRACQSLPLWYTSCFVRVPCGRSFVWKQERVPLVGKTVGVAQLVRAPDVDLVSRVRILSPTLGQLAPTAQQQPS
jgi:hypothetical protein